MQKATCTSLHVVLDIQACPISSKELVEGVEGLGFIEQGVLEGVVDGCLNSGCLSACESRFEKIRLRS